MRRDVGKHFEASPFQRICEQRCWLGLAFVVLIILAIAWNLFYGLIIKLTFHNEVLFTLKTYVSEALVLASLAILLFHNKRVYTDKLSIALLAVITVVFAVGLALDDTSNALYIVRDVMIPFCFLLVAINSRLDKDVVSLFMKWLTLLLAIYTIGSLILYIIEAVNGYEWTAKFYTGYTFWGQDPISKIHINSNGKAMRLPALTGMSVKSALYCVLALIVFLVNKKLTTGIKFLLSMLAVIDIWLFNNRGSLFAAVIVIAIYLTLQPKVSSFLQNHIRVVVCFIAIISGAILLALIFGATKILNMESVFMRFEYWSMILSNSDLMWQLLLPTKVFTLSSGGAGIDGLPLSTDWDNGFLYIAFSFGLLTLVLVLVLFFTIWKKTSRFLSDDYQSCMLCRYLLIATAALALSTNVFQGRSWFFMFVLVFGITVAGMNGQMSNNLSERAQM